MPSPRIAWIHCLCVACLLILCCGTAWGAEYRASTEPGFNIEDDDRDERKALGPQSETVVISGRGFFQGNSYNVRVTEGLPKILGIKLSSRPTADVVLTFSSPSVIVDFESGNSISVTPSTLTFTPANWSTPQEVEVAVPDNNRSLARCNQPDQNYPDNSSAQATVDITPSDNTYSSPGLNIFAYDNDNPNCNAGDYLHDTPTGITAPDVVTMDEGSTTTMDVKLAVVPAVDVTVTFSDDGDSDVNWLGTTLSGNVLTFTPTNWNVAQTVTLTAADDDDFADDEEVLTLTASTGGGYDGETTTIRVTIDDNTPGIIVPMAVTVSEGMTTTVDVMLSTVPGVNVTVTFSDDGDSDVNWSGTTLSGNALTFTPTNWNIGQTVTLTVAEDDDFVNDEEVLTLTASTGGGYDGETATIRVTIEDDDAAGITVLDALTVDEGSTKTVDVTLTAAPTGDMTVTFSDDGDSDVSWSGTTLSGNALTFTPTNWNVAQTVALTAAQDDGFTNDTETLTLTAANGGYNGITANITVTIEDDDAAGITVPDAVTVDEGSTTTVDVTLAAAPTGDMTITFSNDGDSDVSWSGTTLSNDALTFTPLNWNVSQTVTLTAAQDDDFANEEETLTLTAADGGYNGITSNITVTINDNTLGIIAPTAVTMIEGSTTTVDVTLATAPTNDMTVTFSDDGDSDVSWSGTTLSNDALTFTPLNWNVSQMVTLTAAEDDDFVNDTETLTLTAVGGGYNGETAEITVTVDDNTHGIIAPMAVTMPEGGSVIVEVKLALAPTGFVTVTFSDDGDSDVSWSGRTMSGNVLFFTTTNWNIAQTVMLTAAEDNDFTNDTETVTLTASRSGGYSGETANITVTIDDDDVAIPGITVPATATVNEGSTTTVDVTLATVPTGNVTVTFSDDGDSDVSWSGTTLSGDALTFTTENWNVAQTVTLTAAEDDDIANDEETLTLTASTSGGYNGETANITVTINDDDAPGITVPSIVSLVEGSTTTVDVTLATVPTGNVTVTLSDDGDSDVSWSGTTLSGDALTFTTENWNVAQTVTLTAAEDVDIANDEETLTLTASTSGGYNGETAEITVTIDDDDH